MKCPACRERLRQHAVLTMLWRCLNPFCREFDRWRIRREREQ